MAAAVAHSEFDALEPTPLTCPATAGAKHLHSPCLLPPGHGGYHETRLGLRLQNGVIAVYLYAWLDH
jgi:hypothetical protein